MADPTRRIRAASPQDAAAIAQIYGRVVTETPASFELEPPDEAEMARRIEETSSRFPWIVWDDGGVKGYAYATAFRARAAYRWSVEVSIYLAEEVRGRGVGKHLLDELIEQLRARGFVNVVAGITLPNPASVELFESRGFRNVGTYPKIGHKLGRWHDVGYWQLTLGQLTLGPHTDHPAHPHT